VKHFTPWDANLGVIMPADAIQANPEGRPTADNKNPDDKDCAKRTSSYVNQNSRVFHDDIHVPGTDIALHYSGDRVGDYVTEITVPASGATVPESLERIVVEVEIAGRTLKQTLPPESYQMAQLQWDGYDYLGRSVVGPVKAYVKIGFEYEMEYAMAAPDGSPAFARSGIVPSGIPAQQFGIMWKAFPLKANRSSGTIAEGWTLSSHHHAYAQDLTKLFKGDGTLQIQDDNIISTITGGNCGLCVAPPEFGDVGIAAETSIVHPHDTAVDAAGSVYIAARNSALILRVDRDGSIRAVAGGGINAGEIEDIPAIEVGLAGPQKVDVDLNGNIYFIDDSYGTIYKVDTLGIIHIVLSLTAGYSPTDIALDPEGNLYFSNAWPGRVYKIDKTGTITPVAGADTYDFEDDYGEGGLALDAKFGEPADITLDSDGNLYIVADFIHRILKVDPGGIITTYAGNGVPETSGDGGAAVDASLFGSGGLAFDNFGNLYFSAWSHQRVRRINKDGIITTIVGTGDDGYFGDGGLPVNAHLSSPAGIAAAPDGSIYIADFQNHAVRRVSAPINYDNAQADTEVVFVDNNQQGYVISYTGQHDRTIDMQTGVVLKSFAYDLEQRLVSITDQFGNQTSVESLPDGTPTAILSPDGLRTELAIDGNNHLVAIRYPDNGTYRFEYTPGGLVTKKIEPEDNVFNYAHDSIGRVADAYDQEGGHWTFSWTTNPNGEFRTEVISAEGGLTSFVNHTDANGMITATSTYPTGGRTIVTKSEDGMTTNKSQPCGMRLGFEYGIDSIYRNKYLSRKTLATPAGLEKTIQINKDYQDRDADGISDLMTKTIEVNGKSITIANDILSSEKVVTSSEGRTVTFDYDHSNLLTLNASIPGLNPIGFGYDPKGRLTSVISGTRQTIFTYNDQGFIDSNTDPENQTTTYSYDAVGRVTGIDRPDGSNIGFTYGANGNMTVLTNPGDVDHEFTYNKVNRMDGNLTPISGNYSYVYDKDRRLIQTLFPSGRQINNIYTESQLTQIRTPEGDIDLTYGCGGSIDTMSAHGESLAYTYDGNLLTSMTYTGTLNQTLDHTYNDDFDVISFNYAGGAQSYSYDMDGLLTGAGGYTITRNAQNGLPEAVSGAGLNIDRTFNGYGELASQSVTVNSQSVMVWTLTRDDNGRIIDKIESVDGQTSDYNYSYDAVGRLLTVSKNGELVEEYGYDIVGTRILETNTLRGITDRNFSYSDEDHLLAVGDAVYSYNLDGFLSTKTQPGQVTTYAYSSRGELQEVQLPDGRIISYDHDPLGRRIAKRIDGAIVEKYLWQGRSRLLAVYDGSDNLIQRFEYADGRMPGP
jgi:YD repeat-containing protein